MEAARKAAEAEREEHMKLELIHLEEECDAARRSAQEAEQEAMRKCVTARKELTESMAMIGGGFSSHRPRAGPR